MTTTNEPKVSRELAESEFAKWVDAMGLARKLNPAKLNEEDRVGLTAVREVLLGALEDGALVVDDQGRFVFTPTVGTAKPLVFDEPTGASLLAMDKAVAGAGAQRQFKFLADMAKTTSTVFVDMKQRDVAVCDAIATIFLVR